MRLRRAGAIGSVLAGLSLAGCLSSIDQGLLTDGGAALDGADAAMPSDGGEDASDAGSTDLCPTGMVRVGGAAPFCVDTTEVTVAAYAAFLDTPWVPDTSGGCRFNATRTPELAALGDGALPIRAVDWCDATAYCAWAGKRLCGRVGGGRLTTAQASNTSVSELAAACSSLGVRAFPYGDAYDPDACNGERPAPAPAPAGSFGRCVTVEGAFDVTGNVEEWVDACDADQNGSEGGNGGNTPCAAFGGSHLSGASALSCSSAPRVYRKREPAGIRGFRCCATP